MISTCIVALASLTVPPGKAAGELQPAPREPRRFHEIHADLTDAMRRESRARSPQDRALAIHDMTDVYWELKTDPRSASSHVLKGYKAKLWSRLTRVKRDLEREFGKQPPAADGRPSLPQRSPADEATEVLAGQLTLVGYTLGGPARLFSGGGGRSLAARGGGGRSDYGPALVALIERTIAPQFWDVNGGPGTIMYYAPLHALVVRATGDIHRRIGGVLGGLRDAR